MRDRGVAAGRSADWAGVGIDDGKASHVERLFGFVLERRNRAGHSALDVAQHEYSLIRDELGASEAYEDAKTKKPQAQEVQQLYRHH